ncbi:MAG: GIY-YIG nuclease family protein [Bacteroidales bacterium]
MAQGYVYALINPSLHGLVKVGKTIKEPEVRAKEISSDTGVPTPFIVAFKVFVSDCDSAESYLHSLLEVKGFRVNKNREFFNAPLEEIISSMIELQSSSNFQVIVDSIITTDQTEFTPEFKDDFLDNLQLDTTPHYVSVLNDAEDSYYGLGDTLKDYEEALVLYKHAIKLGAIEAHSKVGQMYMEGEECRADSQIALNYFKEGISKGDENCYYYMGRLFSEMENMNKCFKKYFLSSAFIEDKKYMVLYNDRMQNILSFLIMMNGNLDKIDIEILKVFNNLREEVYNAYEDQIKYLNTRSNADGLIFRVQQDRATLLDLLDRI